ncbi:MAG: hypothetical protein ACUVWN_16840 [bacterium]
MKKKEFILFLSASIFAGLIGGMLSSQLIFNKTAYAQEEQQYGTLVQAQELRLVDKNGNPLIALAISENTGEPFLLMYSKKDNKYRFMIDIDDGNPRLIMRDKEAQTRIVLGSAEVTSKLKGTIEKKPISSIVMFDKDGKLIWSAP